ncbi:MAG: hypothetical protein BAJALOKI2v1_490004 [Promethearchaeota archaeon]|nr:MAG: hypothetical protein BAJALOKI2v1_490004 [Candidatus Lokiarchaeota archaeon]
MEFINLLANKLGKKIGISSAAARGLLKLAIKDELGPFVDLNGLNYEKFDKIIHNSLKERLKVIGIEDIEEIIEYLAKKNKENQSLITMEKV